VEVHRQTGRQALRAQALIKSRKQIGMKHANKEHAIHSIDRSVKYKALRQKTEELTRLHKSFSKHVRHLWVNEHDAELLHEKHFQEATEAGGQVLDDFISHRTSLLPPEVGRSRNVYVATKKDNRIAKVRSRVDAARENVDSLIAGMKRLDRSKIEASWNNAMESAYQEFIGTGRHSLLKKKSRAKTEHVSSQSNLKQSMANFLRFGKISIKIPTTQARQYRSRLVGGASGDRRIVRELVVNNPPMRQMTVTPMKGSSTKAKSALWKKIAAKVQKIGNARKLTDSKYGHHHVTGLTEGEAAIAEIRLSEAILGSHNCGVELYIASRAKYLKHRSKLRMIKNEERILREEKRHQIITDRGILKQDIAQMKNRIESQHLGHQWCASSLERITSRKATSPDRSVKRFILGRDYDQSKDATGEHLQYKGAIKHRTEIMENDEPEEKSSIFEDSDDFEEDEEADCSGVESVDSGHTSASHVNLKRLRANSKKYIVRVRAKGGGGFVGDNIKRPVPVERLKWAATVLQKVVRGYMCRLFAWGKRWLLTNLSSIFEMYSGDSTIIDLRPFAMMAGMFGRSIPQNRTIASHQFMVRYKLHQNRGLTLEFFKLWVEDENIAHAENGFERIRVAQMAKAQYRALLSKMGSTKSP
jgi:hypothetical protein